jgi:Arc/MetJ family transcription regulator
LDINGSMQHPLKMHPRSERSQEIIMGINLNTQRKASMRTTLEIDDDLIAAAQVMVQKEGATCGHIVSRLLRKALTVSERAAQMPARRGPAVTGFCAFHAIPGVIGTNEQINALRDAEGI